MTPTRLAILTLPLAACFAARALGAPVTPSYHMLTSGNGFGFSVFDADAKKLTSFLERPARYLRAGADPKGEGVYRRDLAHEAYFGIRADGIGAWFPSLPQSEAGYVEQTGVVRSASHLGALRIESYYFAPYGLSANALVMIARVTNRGATPTEVDLFALPDFRLGEGGDEPSAAGESIRTSVDLSIETGALGERGGAMVYLPLSTIARASCSSDAREAVRRDQPLPDDQRNCDGDDRTLVFQSSPLRLASGDSADFALLIGYSPAASGAQTLATSLREFVNGRSPAQLLADALAEWEAWRRPPPDGLSPDERRVYRQAEATLRMSQLREPYAPDHRAYGMLLASLPPGIWHIGWVRDASYAIVALARSGHLDEARDGLRFLLSAQSGHYASYLKSPYRISVTRYFGDGVEESDWNEDGPNVEMDGWGSFLWALRQYIDAAGSGAILSEALPTQEATLEVVRKLVAGSLLANQEANGLIGVDTSIWEAHWQNRKHYAYTSLAAARGLCDLAAVEERYADSKDAALLRAHAARLRDGLVHQMLDAHQLLGGSEEGIAHGTYHDAAALEAFNWEIFDANDPLYPATLAGLDEALRLPSGGYKRNDDNGSHYDSNEWLFVDLRMAGAQRLRGNAARADELIAWVTAQAHANYDLIPELLNAFPDAGPLWSFAGATPMVGFGAAAYMLALEQRAGMPEAHDCGTPPAPAKKRTVKRLDRRVAVILVFALAAIGIVLTLRRRRRA